MNTYLLSYEYECENMNNISLNIIEVKIISKLNSVKE